jgi:hypothetical protein
MVAVAAPTRATTGAENPATLLSAAIPPDITSGSTIDVGRTRCNITEILLTRRDSGGVPGVGTSVGNLYGARPVYVTARTAVTVLPVCPHM